MTQTSKKPTAGIFIDDANVFYSQKKCGWKIDLQKLKTILSYDFEILIYRYYIAIPQKNDPVFTKTQKYLKYITKCATVKSKALKYIHTPQGMVKKGNVDVEITLDVVRNMADLDIIIIVSGDSDFLELRSFVLENQKKIIFLGFKQTMSWELKRGKYFFINKWQNYLERGKKTPGTMPRRLLLTKLYQNNFPKSTKKHQ